MKQIITFLTIFSPFILFSQVKEDFSGPSITTNYPWAGDLEQFYIGYDHELVFSSWPGEAGEASVYLPVTFATNMVWEIRFMLDFKMTNSNNARLYLFDTGDTDDTLYYIQLGNNNGQISLYSYTNGKSTLRISGRNSLTEPFRYIEVKLELKEGRLWTLFTKSEDENEYITEGTYDHKLADRADQGYFEINCRYIKSRESGFYFDYVYIFWDDNNENSTNPPDEQEDNDFGNSQLVINEVMANPVGLKVLPQTEYIELRNPGEKEVQSEKWQLCYGTQQVILPPMLIPAEGFVVLYKESREIWVDEGGLELGMDNFPAALANNGKQLRLLKPDGTVADEYFYDQATPGRSWERGVNGWHLSEDLRGGTPGSENSIPPEKPIISPGEVNGAVEPSDIIFNELLPDPVAGGSEYIELFNRSGKTLSVAGLAIAVRKADGNLNTAYPLSSITMSVEENGYLVLTKQKQGVTAYFMTPEPELIHELKIPILANTGSTLVLYRVNDSEIIDQINYTNKWHSSTLSSYKGVALERLNSEHPTQDASNWNSASAISGYGTPGYKNSQSGSTEDKAVTTIGKVYWHEDGSYTIPYKTDRSGYNCRAEVYDIEGALRAEIANHELLGTEGEIEWDGYSLKEKRLPQGLYILYVELYHTEGSVHRFKHPLPVR